MAYRPLTPPHIALNITHTPVFVPTPHNVLAIESYFGLGGPGLAVAFLYNPLDPKTGIAISEEGHLAPVLEERWLEFERAVGAAHMVLQETWGVGSWWSRPQNTTCPTDVYYDLGPGDSLVRFTLSEHTVSISTRWSEYEPDDVQWYDSDRAIKVVDVVPGQFVEVEHIIRTLADELLPWDYSEPPIPPDIRAMVRAIAVMACIRPRRGMRFLGPFEFP
ncbi:hypothetical protein C8F04DRAFT_146436 [Mycena alexandri]|uniref:Uncharacterized protein n=1 Tax=Mycena alexandri TaxID=1745969 RepID=A0AAD6T9S0_9AGAR|nr:hypothetical protein C8F04DRAFT_146436 [Mycena alexandri]